MAVGAVFVTAFHQWAFLLHLVFSYIFHSAFQQPQTTHGQVPFHSNVNCQEKEEKCNKTSTVFLFWQKSFQTSCSKHNLSSSYTEFWSRRPLSLESLTSFSIIDFSHCHCLSVLRAESRTTVLFLDFHDWHQNLTFTADVLWSLKHFAMSDSIVSPLEVCQHDVMFSIWSKYPKRKMQKWNCHCVNIL